MDISFEPHRRREMPYSLDKKLVLLIVERDEATKEERKRGRPRKSHFVGAAPWESEK